jgi:hypothetical protein
MNGLVLGQVGVSDIFAAAIAGKNVLDTSLKLFREFRENLVNIQRQTHLTSLNQMEHSSRISPSLVLCVGP